MNRNFLQTIIPIVVLCLTALSNPVLHASDFSLPDPATMDFQPLNFNAVAPQIETLKSGLEFWHLPDDTLPVVTLIVDIDAGNLQDPDGKVGVAEMTAKTLVRGGTQLMSAKQFTERAELMGFSFSARPSEDYTQISVTCLSMDLPAAMAMLMDAIRSPGFDEEQLALIRTESQERIKRMEQEPFFQAFNTLKKRIYGETHPSARIPDTAILETITREDLVAFHKNYYHPNISRFAVIGAADDADIKELKKTLKAWKGKAKQGIDWPEPRPVTDTATVILVDRPGTQAVVAMGHPGLEPNHPQRYNLEIFNEIFGSGGMSSRLMNQVRTQKGLAYVVFGSHMLNVPKGMFMAACMTQNETAVEAINTILSVTRQMQEEEVSQEELTKTIESLENSFVFKFERPRQVLERLLVYRRTGLPADYLQTYLDNIRKVTPASIREAAAQTIYPDKLQIVVAGPADILEKELEKLNIPIEIISRN